MTRFLRARPFFAALVVGLGLSLWLATLTREGDAPVPDSRPERVLLFAPNLTETAYALGHGDRIVAVTDYCVWPPELLNLPRVGGMVDPNLERVLALSPDLLVVQGQSSTLRELARSHGIRMASVDMDTDLASIIAGIARVDSLLGGSGPPAAERLIADIEARLESVARRGDRDHRPSVLLSLGHDPNSLSRLFTVGSGSFLNELVAIAGGRSQYADHASSYFELSLETLLARPPEILLELRPGSEDGDSEVETTLEMLADLGLHDVAVAVLDFDGTLIPGPRIAETAQAIQDAMSSARGRGPDASGGP